MSVFSKNKRVDVDMTVGSIFRHILMFALPLLIGNLFQQLYNMVDTWVVGNFVSNEAFSAVGTVGPIVNMLIGFFAGLSSGAGVVISQNYGAGKPDKVQDAVHTAMLMTLLLGVVLTFVGIAFVPLAVRLANTPDEVAPLSRLYLTIYFSGIIGLLIYNMGAGIFRAIGNSLLPFLFLVVSALLNTGLDLLFVLKLGMGVDGVAYATIIAQGVSAVLIVVMLLRTPSCARLHVTKLKIHWPILGKIFLIGIPAALQMAITAFSNIFVMGYINHFGKHAMSGWTAYAKVDQLLFLPMQSIALASTTFVGQNLGANQIDRAKKGVRTALLLAFTSTVLLSIPVMYFAPPIVEFFNSTPEVVEFGSLFLRHITPFYVLCCVNQVYASALRGSGNSRAPMVIMLSSFVVFRQIYLYIMANFISNTILPIAFSYPAGWLVCSLATLIYYRIVPLDRHKVVA
ncbi:MAG: MATE family efflux transporter [Clostridia bacterium]|nr:MATE family efflux transporter [Clostridia bacterium]